MHTCTRLCRTRGFTLVELAIVLVIIGLIVGGVLVGRELIQAAEVRAVVSEVEQIRAAVQTFRLKYNCLPGDCRNATEYWGTDTCPAVAYRATPTTVTCNGNGDGLILGSPAVFETHRFWQHLGNAGLIEGQYNGTCGVASSDCMSGNDPWIGAAGISQMKSDLRSDAGYSVVNAEGFDNGYWGPTTLWPGQTYGNIITLGKSSGGNSQWFSRYPLMDTFTARGIDTKLDDGKPKTGRAQGNGGAGTSSADGACISGGEYGTATTDACYMIFKTDF